MKSQHLLWGQYFCGAAGRDGAAGWERSGDGGAPVPRFSGRRVLGELASRQNNQKTCLNVI